VTRCRQAQGSKARSVVNKSITKRIMVATVLGEIINEAGLLTVMHIMIHINAYNLAYREEQS
jgi:hypothetical protein